MYQWKPWRIRMTAKCHRWYVQVSGKTYRGARKVLMAPSMKMIIGSQFGPCYWADPSSEGNSRNVVIERINVHAFWACLQQQCLNEHMVWALPRYQTYSQAKDTKSPWWLMSSLPLEDFVTFWSTVFHCVTCQYQQKNYQKTFYLCWKHNLQVRGFWPHVSIQIGQIRTTLDPSTVTG
jgi:hypothetical protein